MMNKVLKKDDWFFHVIVHPASVCLSAPQTKEDYTPHRPMGVNPRVVSFYKGWGYGIVQ